MRSETDPLACRTLWRRVLIGVVTDLCGTGVNHAGLHEAERWVGSWMSRDFQEVCELADVDPDRTHAELSALLPLSPKERRAEVRERRHGTWELRDAA
ncbi:MAG: hypothetical protein F4213_13300 [Boseongicola sp. SB0677_bin_26]|nr:hypothetical protein [Boseongicola sp. SB0677_bin_26]